MNTHKEKKDNMATINRMGAALVAAATIVAAGCCDKNNCTADATADGAAAPAAQAADAAAQDPNEVVLAVGEAKLTRGALDADVAKILAKQGANIPPEQLGRARQAFAGQLAQEFLVANTLGAKAVALGYAATDADLLAREKEILETLADAPDAPKSLDDLLAKSPLGPDRARDQLKTRIAIEKMIKGEVTDKDATDYTADAEKIIKRIVAENEKARTDEQARTQIEALKRQLDAVDAAGLPAAFAELARTHSDCPSSSKGGDLGEFTHGQMVPEFDKVAFEQEVGTVSAPVKTQFGYHLILPVRKTPAVEAKDDQPAAPEKVQASHILLKTGEPQKVPELSEVVDYLKRNNNGQAINDFVLACVRAANVEAAGEFKQLLPPPETPAAPETAPAETATPAETAPAEAAPAETPVETAE